MLYLFSALVAASIASGHVIRPRAGDPPFQDVPTSAQADNTYNNGKIMGLMPPQETSLPIPEVYGARSIDLPFSRLYHGNMKFFSAGQLNTPDELTDKWVGQPGVIDSANQSACGIPDNAFSISKVAIHPYFLKYAPLDRYCMQDVCISFWNGKTGPASSDMMLKVTDICSTDPNDPTHCEKPGDIKIDRYKAAIMQHHTDSRMEDYPQLMGDEYSDGETWWFFTKCWADAIVQPAYADNWFAQPKLPNNLDWAQKTGTKQYENNKIAYAKRDPPFQAYPNGAYNPRYDDTISPEISDWSPSDPEPEWCPVAGGKGWGNPTGKNCGVSQQVKPKSSAAASGPSSTAPVASSTPMVASTFGTSTTPAPSISSAPAVLSEAEPSTPSQSSTSEIAVIASPTSSTPGLPSITPFSNSTGALTGLDGLGSTHPKAAQGQVGTTEEEEEGDDGETCDAEEETVEQPQEIITEEEEDDECEW